MPGTWQPLVHQPAFDASTMLLLTDGTVMCQETGGVNWWKLTPDAHGSYLAGAWSALAPMQHTRLYYASAVLADGRVIVAGGEYSDAGGDTNACEIYDPVADAWTSIPSPAGWAEVGDASSSLLADGRFLIGNAVDDKTAIYDPGSGTWSAGPTMLGVSNEESWVLLPDKTVLAPQCVGHPNVEKFVPSSGAWVSAGTIPGDLVEDASKEIGPGVLLPDGRAFFVGATGRTALYTAPSVASQPGTWAAGPTFPLDAQHRQLGAKDAPACLLPNGHVLCAVGPVDGQRLSYLTPTSFFEFDGAALTPVPAPPNSGGKPYYGRMLLLPTGDVLFAAGTPAIHMYTPSGDPHNAWRPKITAHPATIRPLTTYTIHGRQLNGLSQAVGFGDDAMAATNYPLVRIRHLASGQVHYARTFDHDTMGVATGTAVHSTNFTVPFGTPGGASALCVVANGIPSKEVAVTVRPWVLTFPIDEQLWQFLIGSLADGPLWVLGPNGPIPVDPWGPLVAQKAATARDGIVSAVKELRALGDEVATSRAKVAGNVPPAVDVDAKDGRNADAGVAVAGAGAAGRRP